MCPCYIAAVIESGRRQFFDAVCHVAEGELKLDQGFLSNTRRQCFKKSWLANSSRNEAFSHLFPSPEEFCRSSIRAAILDECPF